MKTLLFILQKEFRQVFRDKTILAMMFVVPLIQLIIMPLAADFEVKYVNVALVDNDHSSYSEQLIQKIGSTGFFHIIDESANYQQALEHIQRSEADVLLEIPANFERDLTRDGAQKVMVSLDAINAMKSNLGGAYLMSVIADFNQEKAIDIQLAQGTNAEFAKQISLDSINWYNVKAEYKYYIVPAILVLLLTIIGGFLTALNIVREKEIGTIEQINVSPIKKWQFILGKLAPFWVVGMIVFTLGLCVMRYIYGIIPVGSILTLYLFAALYMVAILGFGLLVSTMASNQLQAMFIAFFFVMIFILMSGLFTSIDSMPEWAHKISMLTPVTHFIIVVRLIVLKGSEFAHVQNEFINLFIFAVVLNGLAIWNYRKTF